MKLEIMELRSKVSNHLKTNVGTDTEEQRFILSLSWYLAQSEYRLSRLRDEVSSGLRFGSEAE